MVGNGAVGGYTRSAVSLDKGFENMDKSILIYYSAGLAELTKGLKKVSAFARAKHKTGCYLRSAEAFDGEVEHISGLLPAVVVLFGDHDGPALTKVGEAYRTAEVEVQAGDFEKLLFEIEAGEANTGGGENVDDREGLGLNVPTNDEDDAKLPTDELALLKAQATELGINFNPNIGVAALTAKVKRAKADAAAKE